MSYAVSRTKLANLLIKAGYDKAKSLRAVKYPYIESMQLIHNPKAYDSVIKSKQEYEDARKVYEPVSEETGYVYINDTDYGILSEHNKVRAYVIVTQQQIDDSYNGAKIWVSSKLKANIKFRHKYPYNREQDSLKTIGNITIGVASTAGEYGKKEGTIPLPIGGWEKIELPEE